MKMVMIAQGDYCGLKIDPVDDEGRALLAAFGIKGDFHRQLGGTRAPLALSAEQLAASYEGTPVLLE